MKQACFLVIALLLCPMAFADAATQLPTAFYGIVGTSAGTPINQTFTASINGFATSTVIRPDSTYSCGESSCNYYLLINRKAGDNSSSEIVFSINGNMLLQKGTFSQGAIVRFDFPDVPQSYLACLSNCKNESNSTSLKTDESNSTGSRTVQSNSSSVQLGKTTLGISHEIFADENSSTAILTVTNSGNESTGPFTLREQLPSGLGNASSIIFSVQPKSIEASPTTATWEIASGLSPGDQYSVTYLLKKKASLSDLRTEARQFTVQLAEENASGLVIPEALQENRAPEQNNLFAALFSSELMVPGLAIGAALILVIIGLALFLHSNKRRGL
ncbi:MAG: hypothetical protein NT051_01760 [Candidatus Micrarchaeota archaeon]|nr:hypothetical protein [Candidatus Micrarchaeota archaeon]